MYNIKERREIRVDPAQIEEDTYMNLLALARYTKPAEAIGMDIAEDLNNLRLLAKQLTINYLRNEEKYNG